VKRETKAAIILSLLSPIFAEVLTGSTPPLECIMNPLAFPSLWAFYGSGVLLIRELWVRKNPTPGGIMLGGFAYGVLEEGVFIKSWFDPHWPDLGLLGTYGRIGGVNTVWAVWLTIFHGFMSIWVPIMVFILLFPDLKHEPLLTKKSASFLIALYLSVGILMNIALDHYRPSPLPYLFTIALAVAFLWYSTKLRLPPLKSCLHLVFRCRFANNAQNRINPKKLKISHRFRLTNPFVLGLAYAVWIFSVFVFIPYTKVPFIIPIILGIPVAIAFYMVQVNMKDKDVHALMLGALSLWLVFYSLVLATMGHILELPLGWGTYAALVYMYKKRYGLSIFDKSGKFNYRKQLFH